ncbi:hypothetical protein H6G96_37635 [Nostoc sp. FACHB-892]|uniref:hypothetical protein n=1 Tax=Nostoc sp. FACHB-892 TaxID=2692843 RepID=UPI0016834D30|nr:hypothetical protein [Nostoc sp. FACHB-892]MBD2731846.1 hypothetical protein [Nostoc sp. FACHB-892]
MANFQQAPGKVYPGFNADINQFKIPLGNDSWKGSIFRDIALWGGDDFGNPLTLVLDDPNLAAFRELNSPGNNLRVFRFYGQSSGETVLRAFSSDGRELITPLNILVTGTEAGSESLSNFLGGGREDTARAIVEECRRHGITLKTQLAYILGTCEHESAFRPIRESWVLTPEERATLETAEEGRKQKLSYYPFYGRGFIQLTHEPAYSKFATLLDIDLHDDPDLALQPNVALFVTAYGMAHSQFGQPLSRYVNESQTDFIGARNSVNSGDNQANREKIKHYAETWLNHPVLSV